MGNFNDPQFQAMIALLAQSQGMYPFGLEGAADSRPSSPETSKPKEKVLRPPNAFMLYRSHLLKNCNIPKIEKRQQNISRIAGECWNLLSDEEKQVWRAQANKVQEEHKRRHPDYKFSPERKNSRKKAAGPDAMEVNPKDHIRHIREKYVGIMGPAPPPPRTRKPRTRRGAVESSSSPSSSRSPASHPPSLHPSPSYLPASEQQASAAPAHLQAVAPHPMPHMAVSNVPPPTVPAYSGANDFTMLGLPPSGFFPPDFMARYPIEFPSESAIDDGAVSCHTPLSSTTHFDDISTQTPKASTFGDISLPASQKYAFPQQPLMPGASVDSTHDNGFGVDSPSVAGPSTDPQGAPCPASPTADWASLLNCDMQGSGMIDLSAVVHDPSLAYAYDFEGDVIFTPSE